MSEQRGIPAGLEPKLTAAISEFFARTYEGESEADVLTDIIADVILAERERMQIANAHLSDAAPELLAALSALLERYVGLVESGDAGFWDAEAEEEVINARDAIAKAGAA
jgi:hypothetical protein